MSPHVCACFSRFHNLATQLRQIMSARASGPSYVSARALRRLYMSRRTLGRSEMSGIASGMSHVTLGAEEAGTFLITG